MVSKKALSEKIKGIDASHGLELSVDWYQTYYVTLIYGKEREEQYGATVLRRRDRKEISCIGTVPSEAFEKVKKLQKWIEDITGARPTAYGRFIDGVQP